MDILFILFKITYFLHRVYSIHQALFWQIIAIGQKVIYSNTVQLTIDDYEKIGCVTYAINIYTYVHLH